MPRTVDCIAWLEPPLWDAGVKIALGSDVCLGTAAEIQLMIRHGLTPAAALTAATSTAAQHWTWPDTSAPWQRARSPTCS